MPDFDHDDLLDDGPLRDAFSHLRAASVDLVPPQGPTGVRRTVRRRRTARATTLAVAMVAVVAVPVTLRALAHPPTPPAPATSTSPEPSPFPSPSTSTEPSPSGSPRASATSAPNGHISQHDLGNATLTMPAWQISAQSCRAGKWPFHDGVSQPPITDPDGPHVPRAELRAVGYADVDHDGAQETAGLFTCGSENDLVSQVVAFDRDAEGRIVTLGRVVGHTDTITYLFDVEGASDGTLRVEVGDRDVCCGEDPRTAEHQWRRYAFDGTAFHQVGGPTSFTPAVPETPVRSSLGGTVVLGTAAGGVRTGQVVLTVTNAGPNPAPGVLVDVVISGQPGRPLPKPVTIAVVGVKTSACAPVRDGPAPIDLSCHLPGLKPNESREYTLALAAPVADDGVIAVDSDNFYLMAPATSEQPGVRLLPSDTGTPTNSVAIMRQP